MMKALAASIRELAGLFVDDGSLALAILAIVASAALAAALLPDANAAGAVLLVGCLAALVANVLRAARK